MSTSNKQTQVARDLQMIAGIRMHMGTVPRWIIGGVVYSAQEALDTLQARVDAANDVIAAKAAYLRKVQVARATTARTKKFPTNIREVTYLMFESQVDTLADFGIAPHKVRAEPSALEKAQSVERNRETRALRHTMGPKEGAKIKSSLTVTVTTTTAPAAISVTTSPTPERETPDLRPP